MLKTFSIVNLNPRLCLQSDPENLSYRSRNSVPNPNNGISHDFQNVEETLDRKKARKKRVILKSQQKFPLDFFNERSNTSGDQIRQNTGVPGEFTSSRIQRTSSEGLLGTGTPRFSCGMSIFSTFKAMDNNNKADSARLLTNSSKMITEENDSLSISKKIIALQTGTVLRSQNLMNYTHKKERMTFNKAETTNEENFGPKNTGFQSEAERHNISSATIQQRLGHQKLISKRRVSSLSFLQNSFTIDKAKAENHYSYPESENKENASLLDGSDRIILQEVKNQKDQGIDILQIQPDYFPKIKAPEKMSRYLPAIRNEAYKIEIGTNPIKVSNSLPTSHRENYNVRTGQQIDLAVSSTKTKLSNLPLMVNSQGGTLIDLRTKSSRQIQRNEASKVSNSNSMTKLHSSIIKSMESHFKHNRPGKENFMLKPRESINSKRLSSKGKSEENIHKQLQNAFAHKDEHKDLCEFSFSKNFYKDSSSKRQQSALVTFDKDNTEKNHIKIAKNT